MTNPRLIATEFLSSAVPGWVHRAYVLPGEGPGKKALWLHFGPLNSDPLEDHPIRSPGLSRVWRRELCERLVIAQVDGRTPLGDSYQVDSDVQGAFGTALTEELIPFLASEYGCADGECFVTGTSTGGWVAINLQLRRPDLFSGAFAFDPDPLSFSHLGRLDLYRSSNAYVDDSGDERRYYWDRDRGKGLTFRQATQYEASRSPGGDFARSKMQFGSWCAAFGKGPLDANATPWNSVTGEIDASVVEAWRRFDLTEFVSGMGMERQRKVEGKIRIEGLRTDPYGLEQSILAFEACCGRYAPRITPRIAFREGTRHPSARELDWRSCARIMLDARS